MTSIAVQMALYVTWPLWASATCCEGLGFSERLWAYATAAHYRLGRKTSLHNRDEKISTAAMSKMQQQIAAIFRCYLSKGKSFESLILIVFLYTGEMLI